MAKKSAGLLMFRRGGESGVEVLLAHPGGPFWAKKDRGAWSLPKGEHDDAEDPLQAAKREFHEETGFAVCGPYLELGSVRQPSGKIVAAWAFESDCDVDALVSNEFSIEWPPRSGRTASFPEVDRAAWFSLAEAREKINKAQLPFLGALETLLLQQTR